MTPEAALGGAATLPTIGAWRSSAAPPAFIDERGIDGGSPGSRSRV